ncbi:hypothetical protein BGW38_000695, partial [Lunasporangiospora selenospora]
VREKYNVNSKLSYSRQVHQRQALSYPKSSSAEARKQILCRLPQESFNLGCFMCIRCSGVHRSMGTHISKVKSVDLDSWTPEQVENMIKWGNEKANMYWESRLPESSIPNEKSKYEYRQFAKKGSVPDPSELGPIDEALLMELYGKSDSQSRFHAQGNRSSGSESFTGTLAPPPSSPARSSFPRRPQSSAASSASSGVQGADLFSIGKSPSPAPAAAAPVDFFGLNDPAPAASAAQKSRPLSTSSTPSQDLFSMTSSSPASNTSSVSASNGPQSAAASPKPAGSSDWKSSIMSLYGNQSPRPQQPQPTNAGFGQLQGMNVFGFGTTQPQQQQQQQHFPQQSNPWGNDDGFGVMQQASANNGANAGFGNSGSDPFGAFTTASSPAPATMASSGFGNNKTAFNAGVPQGGDLFGMITGTTKSPVASPPQNNKNNSAFGDLTWN